MEQFNSIVRQHFELFKAFVSRLTLLLDYYVSSRYVKDLNTLCSLLISDHVKTTLSESSLSHVHGCRNNTGKYMGLA